MRRTAAVETTDGQLWKSIEEAEKHQVYVNLLDFIEDIDIPKLEETSGNSPEMILAKAISDNLDTVKRLINPVLDTSAREHNN